MQSQALRPEVIQAFSSPLIAFNVPQPESLNAELRSTILARRECDPGIVRSNINGWHSGEDFAQWGGNGARQVAQLFAEMCNGLTEFSSDGGRSLRWVVRMWANVLDRGGFNQRHFHPGAFWSGVYYVDDVRVTSDEDVGADLVIYSPHECASTMYAPDVFIRLPNGHRVESTLNVRSRPGLGIFFPSWLPHDVSIYLGSRPRISIALNFSFAPAAHPA
jgi:uncharacterized protein (TIGR02466 family)